MADGTIETEGTEVYKEARETQDLSISGFVKFVAGLAVGIVISMMLMMALYRFLTRRLTGGSPVSRYAIRREERLPPPPRLLTASGNRFKPEDFTDDPALQRQLKELDLNFELQPPGRYREVYDQVKQRELTSYGVMTKQPGEFRIPIEEAKRLLIERGATTLPAQQLGPTPAGRSRQRSGTFGEDLPPTSASAGRVPEGRKD